MVVDVITGLYSNDARSCYDLIGHSQASMAMQRNGVPRQVVDCLFSTLQQACHRVRTGYGDSLSSYGGPICLRQCMELVKGMVLA
jgi:hypothetical protein